MQPLAPNDAALASPLLQNPITIVPILINPLNVPLGIDSPLLLQNAEDIWLLLPFSLLQNPLAGKADFLC